MGTRCANPEYKLDVDIMIIDYHVHKAVETTIEVVRHQVQNLADEEESDFVIHDKLQQALRLQQNISILLRLFEQNHATHQLSSGCTFNLKILDFLMLLCSWIQTSSEARLGTIHRHQQSDASPTNELAVSLLPAISPDSRRRERAINTVLRRNWLSLRYHHDDSNAPIQHENNSKHKRKRDEYEDGQRPEHGDLAEVDGYFCTTKASSRTGDEGLDPPNIQLPCLSVGKKNGKTRLGIGPDDYKGQAGIDRPKDTVLSLYDLLPLFMQLSVEISRVMGDVSSRWIDLAAEFGLQAGLERLQQFSRHSRSKAADSDPRSSDTDYAYCTWIEECFAWGSVKRPTSTSLSKIQKELHHQGVDISRDKLRQRLDQEDLASAMFNSTIDLSDNNEVVSEQILKASQGSQPQKDERPRWKKARRKNLNKLLELIPARITKPSPSLSSTGDAHPLPFILDLLPNHSITTFLQSLLHYIDGIWSCNTSDDISGKPVLIQIEEGGLDGLGEKEFEAFLERVDLKSSQTVNDHDGKGNSDLSATSTTRKIRWAL